LTSLLGYGIVGFPKFLWNISNDKRTLAQYQFEAPDLIEKIEDERRSLKEDFGVNKINKNRDSWEYQHK
jgi:hypothetical protein